ncbi:hypothetical protein KSS87_021065 [Heliosperma pusillum]|nr:hypothetical protein KSS87_021065 [Heliosperma pusillum]
MDAATCLSSISHIKFHNPSSSLLTENVRGSTSFANCNMLSFQSTGTGTRACVIGTGNSPDGRIVDRDRLIALFKRIQDSISTGKSGIRNGSRSLPPTDDISVETLVSRFPYKSSSRQVKLEQSKPSTGKGREPMKEKSLHEPQHSSSNKLTRSPSNFTKKSPIPSPTPLRSRGYNVANEVDKLLPDLQHSPNHKLTRLPSNFVKKSPIPSPTTLRGNEHNMADEVGLSSEAHSDAKKLEEMKLGELKGIAKERGIKGYSKLKKSELLELLRFQI